MDAAQVVFLCPNCEFSPFRGAKRLTFAEADGILALGKKECQQSEGRSAKHGSEREKKENTRRRRGRLHRDGRAGRQQGHRAERGPGLLLGHDPQRAGRAGRDGLSRAAAHLRRPRADGDGLPALRQRADGEAEVLDRRERGPQPPSQPEAAGARRHDRRRQPPRLAADELSGDGADHARGRDDPALRSHLRRTPSSSS